MLSRVAAQKLENIIIIWKHLRLLNNGENNTLRPLVAVKSAPPVPLPITPENLVVRGCAWLCVVVRGRAWSCVVVRGRAPSRPTRDSRRRAAAIR